MMSDPLARADLVRRISAYQVALALKSPSTSRVGPFYARFDLRNPNPFGNYAIPEPGATPSAADVDALVKAYREHARKPRLEYAPAAAPMVEDALATAGFAVEDRVALMSCVLGAERPLPPPHGIVLVSPSTDDDLLNVLTAQQEAFGESTPPGSAHVIGMREGMDRGMIVALARDEATGEPAGGGVCTPLESGVTEIAGIGVRPSFRRRGIAAALTARLTADAFSRGATLAWLTPGGEEAQRIYARAGFEPVGELLMISIPN